MHSRTLTVTATARGRGRHRGRDGQPGDRRRRRSRRRSWRRPSGWPGPVGRRRTRCRWWRTTAHGDDWDAEPETTGIDVLGGVATGLGEAFAQAAANRQLLFGFAEHMVTTTYLGTQHRAAPPRRAADRPAGAQRQDRRPRLVGLGRPGHAGLRRHGHRRRVRRGEHPARTGPRRSSCRRGAYEVLLPPGPVADLMIYMYWTANARDAEEGRNVFSAGEGRTRIGETAGRAADHAAVRPALPRAGDACRSSTRP